jgi:uncharacterized protein
MLTARKVLSEKRNEILAVAEKHGASNVRVFGSAARNEFGPGSDFDLLVNMEQGRSLLDLVALWQDLEEILGCKVDVLTDDGINPLLRERIFAEAIPL